MRFLTNFGDQAVVLPLAVAITMTLLLLGWWRGALGWAVAVSGTLAVILSLKIVFYACHAVLPHIGIRSPSGHTASATVVYAGLMALLRRHEVGHAIHGTGRHLLLIVLATFVLAAAIGFSRVDLGVHTVPDVLVGGFTGILGAVVMVLLAGRPPQHFRRWILGVVVVVVVVLFHGQQLNAEEAIRHFAISTWWPFIAACRHGQP